jgi:uncharacterized protein (TIGR02594 family)
VNRLIEIALAEYGIKEFVGNEDNPEVLKYFNSIGVKGLRDEDAWCSAFMNWLAVQESLPRSNALNARSWLKIGTPVDKPEMGDVVIFWRESAEGWKGHVGLFISRVDNLIYCLGGNQNNMVSISGYDANRLLGYRKLSV